MPTTRSSKRVSAPLQINDRKTKRARTTPAQKSQDVVIINSDEDEDEEMKDILAQIKAQEESEREGPSTSSAFMAAAITLEDDAATARKLAEQWALEDNDTGNARNFDSLSSSSEIECIPGSSFSKPKSHSPEEGTGHTARSPSRHPALVATYHPSCANPEKSLEPFKEVFTRTRKCSNCERNVKSPRGCVIISDDLLLPPSLIYLLHAPCSSCRTNHCRGCFNMVTCDPTCKGPSKNPTCSVLNCCAEVRAIAIFEALGGFDRHFIVERSASESRALAISNAKSTLKPNTVGPGGTGYGTGQADGSFSGSNVSDEEMDDYYYVPQKRRGKGKQKSAKVANKKVADHWETIVLHTLTLLAELLPAPYSDKAQVYDLLPHASIGHLLSLSQIPTMLASLLRNDSVTDWISRKETYNAMLSLLRRMAECELTIQALIGQRWQQTTTCGLENWMWDDGEIIWSTNSVGNFEAAPALYTYFKKLTKQSEAFMAGAMQMLGEGDADAEVDEMMIQGTSLCGDIIASRDDLERAIEVLGKPAHNQENLTNSTDIIDSNTHEKGRGKGKGKGKGRDISLSFDAAYAEACEKLAFKYVSLAEASGASNEGLNYTNYNYAQMLAQTQNSTRLPKDRLHLLKELAVTATSLPPGVWIRVDEVRNDAIKIMIAGPEGTPYAGGLFEFDCFLPIEYPAQPPVMHLRTTGAGSVRFNPNLYDSGKVCLSLLGTWPGRPEEQWSPKSTLLQVIVSIQSMILVDAPYYNEPGYGRANLKAPASIAYNRNISLQTTKWAIVEWLNDQHRYGIWRDVILSHFSIRKDKIRQQIIEWGKKEPGFRAYASQEQNHYGMHIAKPRSRKTKPAENAVNLLEEFDKGIEVIASWNFEDGL